MAVDSSGKPMRHRWINVLAINVNSVAWIQVDSSE
jgi:hypothetical protein